MKFIKLALTAIGAMIVLSAPAAAWGPAGHRLVASLAEDLLTPNAKSHVSDILDATYDLGVAANWADCVRSVTRETDGTFKYVVQPQYQAPCVSFMPPAELKRMEDYVSRNYDNCGGSKPCAADYHFADVPFEVGHYTEGGVGTESYDVEHGILAAIDVLQDKPAPAPFSFIDKKEALILLAHYVGDIHQPLHVGSIYLTKTGKVQNPATQDDAKKLSTFGGNSILTSKTEKLHSLWDSIPTPWTKPAAHDDFIKAAKDVPASTGPIESWPAQWADDSIAAAAGAFDGLKFSKKVGNKWNATAADPAHFLKYRHDTQKQQIARGAARLAAILNTLWP